MQLEAGITEIARVREGEGGSRDEEELGIVTAAALHGRGPEGIELQDLSGDGSNTRESERE